MLLDDATCLRRLTGARFAVLGTTNPDGSPHVVPVVFVVVGDRIGLPIDRVKDKRTTRLRRIANLEERRHASLLVDHRSEQWDDLWWVRADATATNGDGMWMFDALAAEYPQYRTPGAVESIVELSIDRVTGWAAG